jgi:phage terminase small subunit
VKEKLDTMTTSRGGRPADPTAVKLLKGVRPSRINDDEPQVPEQSPTMPDWAADLDGPAGERWRAIWSETLRQASWLRAADQDTLVMYVTAAVDAERLGRALLRSPLLERDAASGGPKTLTVRREWRSAVDAMNRLAREFGLSPVSRQTLKSSLLGDAPSRSHLHAVDSLFDGL